MSAPNLLAAALLFVVALHAMFELSVHRPRGWLSPVARSVIPEPRQIKVAPGRYPGFDRTGARIATIVTVAVLILFAPTRGAPPYAGPPVLLANSDIVSAGSLVSVSGAGFEDHLQGQLALDGDATGMPSFRVRGNGTFDEAFTLASSVEVGPHVVSALGPDVVASVIITVLAPLESSTPSPSPTPTASPSPSPTPTASPTPTGSIGAAVDHVFVVVMENQTYSATWGTPSTPYTTALAEANARAANYYAITHPSLPNYLDLYAGSNYGITTDCNPSSSCHVSARNLADNLEAGGLSWKGYFESMPAPCYTSNSGTYAPRHNPFVYFDDIRTDAVRCAAHVVNYGALRADLETAAATPDFAFVVPNNCNNTHDCSIATGDTWLSNNLPPILDSPACTVQRCLVILTWDEDDYGSLGNHVLTVFAGSAAKRNYVSNARYDHFDMLRTVESLLGVPTQTVNDATATTMSDMLAP